MSNKIIFGDCLEALKTIESESVTAIIIDPPFNTKKVQKRNRIKVHSNNLMVQLQQAIRSAWCQETSADLAWSTENPSLGQCAVTALIVQDFMGGVLMRAEVTGGSHYWNRLPDGTELDLTRDQFAKYSPRNIEERERLYVLSYPATKFRYEMLREVVLFNLKFLSEIGRNGFGDKKYQVEKIDSTSYTDSFDNFEEFLMPRIKESLRTLTPNGSIFIHLDFREVHYIKVAMDKLMGRDHFMNEIIWLFDYGARSKKKWSNKHNTILWYAKDPKNYIFNYSEIDRVPYLAPGLVGKDKAARGKTITAEWWCTIVPTTSKEKTNYPTQKPLKLLERIVKMHSNPRSVVMDFFAGSGTTGMAAGNLGREFIMIDSNSAAIETMKTRLAKFNPNIIMSS